MITRLGAFATALAAVGGLLAATPGAVPAAASPAATTTGVPRPAFGFAPLASGSVDELTAEFRKLKRIGATQIRVNFDWDSIEPTGYHADQSDYYWTRVDNELTAAEALGLHVVVDMEYGHTLYSAEGAANDNHDYPPDDPAVFGRYVGEVATHVESLFPGVAVAYEVWNEENLGARFWKPVADPAQYAELLCASYGPLKSAAPDVPVSIGGLLIAPFGNSPAISWGGVDYLDHLLDAVGDRPCFDAVAYHPYPYPFVSPEAVVRGQGATSAADAVDALRATLTAHGYPATTPILDTEIGWPTNAEHFPTSNGVTEAMQARYLVRMALLSWQRGVSLVDWYTAYDDPDAGTNSDQESAFGVFRHDGSRKPSVTALTTFNRLLPAGWTYSKDLSAAWRLPRGKQGVGEGFALEFSGPSHRHVIALWYANENVPASCSEGLMALNCPVVSSLPKPRKISVRAALPARAKHVTVTSLLGKKLKRSAHLSVGQDPLYLAWTGPAV